MRLNLSPEPTTQVTHNFPKELIFIFLINQERGSVFFFLKLFLESLSGCLVYSVVQKKKKK